MPRHPTPGSGSRDPQNYRDEVRGNKREITGHVEIKGVIETTIPPALADVQTAQRKKEDARDSKRFWLDLATFLVVFIYTTIAALQWKTTTEATNAAQQANRLLEESTRARVYVDPELAETPMAGSTLKFDVKVSNLGHVLATYGLEQRTADWVDMPDGSNPASVPKLLTLIEPNDKPEHYYFSSRDPISQQFLDGLPTMEDTVNNGTPHKLTTYIYGRYAYETLGSRYDVSFCFFLIKASSMTRDRGGTEYIKTAPFILMNCPKWGDNR